MTKPTDDSRAALLRAAAEVFAKKGFDGATVKELADHAGVNVSLVSYYFGGKEGLYVECIEAFGKSVLTLSQKLLKNPESLEDFRARLTTFLGDVLETHVREKNLTSIIHRECALEFPVMKELFRGTFVKVFESLLGFVEAAQAGGILAADFEPLPATALFWGGVINVCRMDNLNQELFNVTIADPAHRSRVVEHAVRLFVDGALRRSHT